MKFSEWLITESNLSGLLQAVVDNPFDEQSWLVLADDREENGDPLGQLIRFAMGIHDQKNINTLGDRVRFSNLIQQLRNGGSFGNVDLMPWDQAIEFDYQTQKMKNKIRTVLFIDNGLRAKIRNKWVDIKVDQLPQNVQRAVLARLLMSVEDSARARQGIPRSEDPRNMGELYASDLSLKYATEVYLIARDLYNNPRSNKLHHLPRLVDSLEGLQGKVKFSVDVIHDLTRAFTYLKINYERFPEVCQKIQRMLKVHRSPNG